MNNIILIGMPGSGKSQLGKMASKVLKMSFVDTDSYIEMNEDMSIDAIFKNGENHFRDIEEKNILAISKIYKNAIIPTGGGSVLRESNMVNLKKNGTVIFVNRNLKSIIKTLGSESRPLLNNNIERLHTLYRERIHLYKKYMDYEFMNEETFDISLNKFVNLLSSL